MMLSIKQTTSVFLTIFAISLFSCSEGDEIELTVDFEADLQSCENETNQTFVFYKTEDDGRKTMSISFTDSDFLLNGVPADEDTLSFQLDGANNILVYREFSNGIEPEDYFCSSIPPSNNEIVMELESSDGEIVIAYERTEEITDTDTLIIYTRNVFLRDITLRGNDLAIRREFLQLGTDRLIFQN